MGAAEKEEGEGPLKKARKANQEEAPAAAASGAEGQGAAPAAASGAVPAAADHKRPASARKQSSERPEKAANTGTREPPSTPAKPPAKHPSGLSPPKPDSKPDGGGASSASGGEGPAKMLDIPVQAPLRVARPSEQAIGNGSSGTVREWMTKLLPSVTWRLSMYLSNHKDVKLDKPLYALQCPIITDDRKKAVHSFKEPMNYTNLLNSCRTTGLYEAGAPIWGIDTMRRQYKGFQFEDPSWPQLSVAESLFSKDALLQSNVNNEKLRRLIVPGIIPVAAESMTVVEQLASGAPACGGMRGWPACGGLVVIWALLSRLDEALENNDETMVLKLYEASLTATVRVRIEPDKQQLILDSIQSAETLRVINLSGATDSFWTFVKDLSGFEEFDSASGGSAGGGGKQMMEFLQRMGIRWKGKPCEKSIAYAVINIAPFAKDEGLHKLVKALENVTMKFTSDPTMLMRVCQTLKAETSGADEKLAKMKIFVEDLHLQLLSGYVAARGANLTTDIMIGGRSDKAARVGPSLAPGPWGIGDGRGG